MKTLIQILILGFTSISIIAQEANAPKLANKTDLFSKYSKYSVKSDKAFDLPELSYNNSKDFRTIRFHSDITVFAPKGMQPFIIYPFDPKVQGFLRVIYPR